MVFVFERVTAGWVDGLSLADERFRCFSVQSRWSDWCPETPITVPILPCTDMSFLDCCSVVYIDV